ncbi:hypothetical protein DFQ26_000183 [Actinomortierella ambigua]|nr:hypothetical protein DFQ26_000183 [Actinomortierella ambigua]
MNNAQIAYIHKARDGSFMLKQWGMLADLSSAETLDSLWTGPGVEYIRQLGEKGDFILNRLSKLSYKERMEIWHDVIQDHQYRRHLRPFAHRQMKCQVSEMTRELEAQSTLKQQLNFDDVSSLSSLGRSVSITSNNDSNASWSSSRKRAREPRESRSAKSRRKKARKNKSRTPANTPASTATSSATTTAPMPTTIPTIARHSTSSIIFDATKALPIHLQLAGFDLGKAFKELQTHAEKVVNDVSIKVSTANVHLFLAGNYIWHAATALPGMSDDTRRSICDLVKVSVARLSSSEVGWCIDLGRQLAETGKVQSRTIDDSREEHITQLFQTIANKLPVEAMPWVRKNEDSHAHGVLDAILTQLFPEGRAPYEMAWANRPSEASKMRRGEPLKPDATILKDNFEVAYLEVKSPKDDRCSSKYLEDFWNLSSFAKDCIDSNLRARRSIRVVPIVQVFGNKVTLSLMRFVSGLYVLHQVTTCYLPRDLHDLGGMIACIETFRALRSILDGLDLGQYVDKPASADTEETLPYDELPRPTNISPAIRPFFQKTA